MAEQEKDTEQEGAASEGSAPEASEAAAADEGVVVERRRPGRPAAEPAGPPTAVVLPQRVPGTPIVSRRRVLQIGFWSSLGAIIAGAGGCSLVLVYPSTVTGFGGRVTVNPGDVPAPGGKKEIAEGRFWLVSLTEEQGGPGLLALWWKCPHLGCTVPWRPTFVWPDPTTGAARQGWFRCPCHGSTYTDAGVRVFGPAPRSLDTMAIEVQANGTIVVDTGSITAGAPDNPSRATRI
jgi:cytochrome b6-f complex iron-sulfur subunit